MSHILLVGSGEVDHVKDVIINGLAYYMSDISHVINRSQDERKYVLIVAEKHFFRNKSRASLTVVIQNFGADIYVDAVGSAGGAGLIFDVSFGANSELSERVANLLIPLGFIVVNS